MRIGLYGGSFNPPHIGHLYIAEEVKRIMRLDEVVMIPAGNPYFKNEKDVADKYHRLTMTKLLTMSSVNDIVYHDLEIKRDGPSYTIDTLRQYKEWYPNAELYLIVGSDAFSDIGSWKEPENIINLCNIIVVGRQEDSFIGYDRIGLYATPVFAWWNNYSDKVFFLDIDKLHISSTMIRNNIQDHKNWKHLTTEYVAEYIEKNHLYGA